MLLIFFFLGLFSLYQVCVKFVLMKIQCHLKQTCFQVSLNSIVAQRYQSILDLGNSQQSKCFVTNHPRGTVFWNYRSNDKLLALSPPTKLKMPYTFISLICELWGVRACVRDNKPLGALWLRLCFVQYCSITITCVNLFSN